MLAGTTQNHRSFCAKQSEVAEPQGTREWDDDRAGAGACHCVNMSCDCAHDDKVGDTGRVMTDNFVYDGDEVNIAGTALATYNSKDVAEASLVFFSGLSLAGEQASNYAMVMQSPQEAEILPRQVTVIADDVTATTALSIPPFSVSYSGLVSGDGVGCLLTAPEVTCAVTILSPAGKYIITPSGASCPNYTFSYVNGVLDLSCSIDISPELSCMTGRETGDLPVWYCLY